MSLSWMKKLSKKSRTTIETNNEVVVVEQTKRTSRFLMRSILFLSVLALYYWLFVLNGTLIKQKLPQNVDDSSVASISVHGFNVKHNNYMNSSQSAQSANANNNHQNSTSAASAVHVQLDSSEHPDSALDQGVTVKTTTDNSIDHAHADNDVDDDNKYDEIDSIDIAARPTQQQQVGDDPLKIAIFMTTSMSAQHLDFLEQCWPAAIEHLPLVRNADLLVYTSNRNYTTTYFRNLGFQNKIAMYYYDELYATIPKEEAKFSQRKQDGAVRAMVDPFKKENQWFQHYDWVVRLNPDVLIRRDEWLLNAMKNASYEGIFGDWVNPKRRQNFLFTDFYAFRPRAVNQVGLIKGYELQKKYNKLHAEAHIMYGFNGLVKNGTIAWIPNIKLYKSNLARTIGPDCDVIHYHSFIKHCPNYFDAHDAEDGYYRQRRYLAETALE